MGLYKSSIFVVVNNLYFNTLNKKICSHRDKPHCHNSLLTLSDEWCHPCHVFKRNHNMIEQDLQSRCAGVRRPWFICHASIKRMSTSGLDESSWTYWRQRDMLTVSMQMRLNVRKLKWITSCLFHFFGNKLFGGYVAACDTFSPLFPTANCI